MSRRSRLTSVFFLVLVFMLVLALVFMFALDGMLGPLQRVSGSPRSPPFRT